MTGQEARPPDLLGDVGQAVQWRDRAVSTRPPPPPSSVGDPLKQQAANPSTLAPDETTRRAVNRLAVAAALGASDRDQMVEVPNEASHLLGQLRSFQGCAAEGLDLFPQVVVAGCGILGSRGLDVGAVPPSTVHGAPRWRDGFGPSGGRP